MKYGGEKGNGIDVSRVAVLRCGIEALGHLAVCLFVLHASAQVLQTEYSSGDQQFNGLIGALLWQPYSHYSILTFIFLVVEGYFVGRYLKLPVVMAALMPPLVLGCISSVEMTLVPGTHNLLGIEVMLNFLFFWVPITLGGMVGRWGRKHRV